MAFERPTLATLVERITEDFNNNAATYGILNVDARIRGSMPWILTRVHAAATWLLYGFLDRAALQILPDTADATNLDRHATIRGLVRTAAQKAQITVTFTGTNGIDIPASTSIQLLDASAVYLTDALGTIAAGTVDIACTAELAGASYTPDAGASIQLVSEIAGVDSLATVAAVDVEGTDEETDEALRQRILDRWQDPPQGGSEADYVAWIKAIGGVDRVFVYPASPLPGEVTIYFTATVPEGGDSSDLQPTLLQVAAAQTAVDLVRPVTATTYVEQVSVDGIDLEIAAFDEDGNSVSGAVEDLIEAELHALYIRRSEPAGTIYNSEIRDAIASVEGVHHYTLDDVDGDGTGLSDITQAVDTIAISGTVTFT